MEPAVPPTIGKRRMFHVLRVIYYMLRKGISKNKLIMDLHLLLKRGKIAGKALGNLMTFHHHHHHGGASSSTHSSFSCMSMDPNLSYYNPREVEFSCHSTPASTKRKNRHHHHFNYDDSAAIAKVFEILNSETTIAEPALASPSPAMLWSSKKSPRMVRSLRITDSPFPIREEEGEADCRIDKEAEEFIRRFYEKLRLQQLVPPTPDFSYCRERAVVGQA